MATSTPRNEWTRHRRLLAIGNKSISLLLLPVTRAASPLYFKKARETKTALQCWFGDRIRSRLNILLPTKSSINENLSCFNNFDTLTMTPCIPFVTVSCVIRLCFVRRLKVVFFPQTPRFPMARCEVSLVTNGDWWMNVGMQKF